MISQGRHVCEQTLSQKRKKESRFFGRSANSFVKPSFSFVRAARRQDPKIRFTRDFYIRSVCEWVCCYLGKIWQSNETLFSLCWTYYAGVMNDFFSSLLFLPCFFQFCGKPCARVFSSSVVNWHFATAASRERGKRKDTFLCVCKQPQLG